jgi:hypothetical protein
MIFYVTASFNVTRWHTTYVIRIPYPARKIKIFGIFNTHDWKVSTYVFVT